MHKYKRLFFSVLVFLIACKSSAPSDIIKMDDMASLLTQVHIIDGTTYNVLQVPDTLYKYSTGRYLALFKKYHTDSVQFKKSFKYYTANPDQLQTIYDKITINIKQITDSLNKVNQARMERDNKRAADSLKRTLKKPPVKPGAPATPAQPVPPSQTAKPAPGKHNIHLKPNKPNAIPN